jgi:MFS family permease
MAKTDDDRDELIFELIKRRLDDESARTDNLDGKASNLIGFVSVVVGLLLGTGTFTLPVIADNFSYSIPYFGSIVLLLVSIVIGLFAFRVRQWIVVPDVNYLLEEYTSKPFSEVLKPNAVEMANAVSDAEKKNGSKADLINWSWYFLIAGLALMLVFLLIYTSLITGDTDHQLQNPLMSNKTKLEVN